jgi:hypothetical protein
MLQFGLCFWLIGRNPRHEEKTQQNQSAPDSCDAVPTVSYASTLHALQDARSNLFYSTQLGLKSPQGHFENMNAPAAGT